MCQTLAMSITFNAEDIIKSDTAVIAAIAARKVRHREVK